MAENGQNDKHIKREARQLREAAHSAFAVGDYGRARLLNAKIVGLAPNTDLARDAARDIERLATDPVAIYWGLGALALYGLGWLVALH